MNAENQFALQDYTIEHVMPQNLDLSEVWQQELGENWQEIQEKYLHTIGNLTLTGYNPELSDRPFTGKSMYDPGGFRHSPITLESKLIQVEQSNGTKTLSWQNRGNSGKST